MKIIIENKVLKENKTSIPKSNDSLNNSAKH